jgi:Peptidase family M1 domain/Tetratricopeptide repeat-like domain
MMRPFAFRRLGLFVVLALTISSAVTPLHAAPPSKPQFQVVAYAIAAEIDPATHKITAQARLTCTALADQSVVVFELHNDLRPTSITDAKNVPLSAERNTQDSTLRITLPQTWTNGTTTTFTFKYDGILNGVEDSPVQGLNLAHIGDPISYLLYAGRWFPMVGYSTSRFAAAITIRVPADYTVIGSGAVGKRNEVGGGKAEYSFSWNKLGFPGTIIAGKFLPPFIGSGNVRVYLTEAHKEQGPDYARTAAEEHEFFTDYFGPVPSGQLNVVELPDDTVPATWGPEIAAVAGSRIAEKNNYRLLANTIAHQWWGSEVSPQTLNDSWIPNGMSRYAEALYIEHVAGKPGFQDIIRDISAGALAYDTIPLSSVSRLDPFSPDFQSLTLDKGAMVFHMLRWVMGDEGFKTMLRTFLKEYSDKAVRTSQLEKTAEDVAKTNLEPFFAQWLDGTGAPDFADKYTVYRLGSNKGFRTVGEVTQDLDLFRMPVQLRIETDGRTEDKRVDVVGTSSPYQEDTFGRPRRILVDPDDWVLKNSPAMQLRVAILRGQQLVGEGDLTGALQEYQKAIQVNATSSLASYRIAEVFLLQRNYQSAANAFRDALRGDDDPKWTEVWSHIKLGNIFDATGQRDRAVNEYRQALQTNDNTQGALSEARKYLKAPYRPASSSE